MYVHQSDDNEYYAVKLKSNSMLIRCLGTEASPLIQSPVYTATRELDTAQITVLHAQLQRHVR